MTERLHQIMLTDNAYRFVGYVTASWLATRLGFNGIASNLFEGSKEIVRQHPEVLTEVETQFPAERLGS